MCARGKCCEACHCSTGNIGLPSARCRHRHRARILEGARAARRRENVCLGWQRPSTADSSASTGCKPTRSRMRGRISVCQFYTVSRPLRVALQKQGQGQAQAEAATQWYDHLRHTATEAADDGTAMKIFGGSHGWNPPVRAADFR